MEDEFSEFARSLTAPATASEVIVPDDVAMLGFATRGIYVGQGGDVSLKMLSGDTVTLRNMQTGTIYPMRVVQVMATGTTATHLVALR